MISDLVALELYCDCASAAHLDPAHDRHVGGPAAAHRLGHQDHEPGPVGQALEALQATETAVILVSAPNGIEVNTRRMFNEAGKRGLARMFVVNKVDAYNVHIDELLNKFKRIDVKAGQVLIREGSEGDYYYVIESGKCRVERMIGGVCMLLAELKSGDAFGEEALVSEAKRNATITMKA